MQLTAKRKRVGAAFEGATLSDLAGALLSESTSALSLCVRHIEGGLASSYVHDIAKKLQDISSAAGSTGRPVVKLGGPYGAGMALPPCALETI